MVGRPKVKPSRLEVKTLINPAIKPLGLVTVKSAGPEVSLPVTTAALVPVDDLAHIPATDGTEPLRVNRVNHDGETRGNVWYTRVEAIVDESLRA